MVHSIHSNIHQLKAASEGLSVNHETTKCFNARFRIQISYFYRQSFWFRIFQSETRSEWKYLLQKDVEQLFALHHQFFVQFVLFYTRNDAEHEFTFGFNDPKPWNDFSLARINRIHHRYKVC